MSQTPSPASVRKLTLFAAINHLAKMADPRLSEPPQASLKAITESLLFARQHDPAFGADVRPLRVPGTRFDREHALDRVLERLVMLVPGEPWTPLKARPPRSGRCSPRMRPSSYAAPGLRSRGRVRAAARRRVARWWCRAA